MEMQAPQLEQWLRMPRVVKALDVSKSLVYELLSRNEFPAPVRLSSGGKRGPVVWREVDIAQWQAERIAASALAQAGAKEPQKEAP